MRLLTILLSMILCGTQACSNLNKKQKTESKQNKSEEAQALLSNPNYLIAELEDFVYQYEWEGDTYQCSVELEQDTLTGNEILRRVGIINYQLDHFPPVLFKMITIKNLNIYNSKIELIPPEIKNLKQLECINLKNNFIRALPKEIGQLCNLKKLYLSEMDSLQILPRELGKLLKLQDLSITNSKIKVVPKEITTLKNLKYLNLSFNHIKELPQNWETMTQLEDVSVCDNELEEIPESLLRLPNLKKLGIVRGNWITQEQLEEYKKMLPKGCEIW